MEGERPPPAVWYAAMSKVLDDDDLLIEILLRVGFPTSLVCAALVCRRWLQHVSDPKFLGCFCNLHPPRLLGFYVNDVSLRHPPCFIPLLPQPPELSAVMHRARFSLDRGKEVLTCIRNCRNGRVFTSRREGSRLKHEVYSPLFPDRGTSIMPQFPSYQRQDDYFCSLSRLLSIKEGNDLSYLFVLVESNNEKTKSMVHVYMLRPGDGFWRRHLTLPTDPLWDTKVVLIDNKIYMPCFPSDIVVLDLMALSFSKISFPQGVECGDSDTMLSRADDASGLYLIQVKELQLCIWLHGGDNWLMVDTIYLVEMCANLRMSDCTGKEEQTAVLRIKQVGDNVEFVFLQMGQYVVYLDIKCRTLRKVYEMPSEDEGFSFYIYPFKMIWPPTFPLLKDDPSRYAFCALDDQYSAVVEGYQILQCVSC